MLSRFIVIPDLYIWIETIIPDLWCWIEEIQNILFLLFFLCRVSGLTEAVVSDSSGENKGTAADVSASQHVMVCALKELGSLVQSLSATAAPLIQEPSIGEKDTVLRQICESVWKSCHRNPCEIWLARFLDVWKPELCCWIHITNLILS